MLIVFRWLLRLFTGLVVLALIAGFLAYYILSRSLPDYNEDFTEAGISAPVEILRNNSDVPHIFGQTDADVYFALGFAHAQDRLWQMAMLRRTVSKRSHARPVGSGITSTNSSPPKRTSQSPASRS